MGEKKHKNTPYFKCRALYCFHFLSLFSLCSNGSIRNWTQCTGFILHSNQSHLFSYLRMVQFLFSPCLPHLCPQSLKREWKKRPASFGKVYGILIPFHFYQTVPVWKKIMKPVLIFLQQQFQVKCRIVQMQTKFSSSFSFLK